MSIPKRSLLGMLMLMILIDLSNAQILTESKLPIVVITTEESIPDEPKIQGFMGIIANNSGNTNLLTDTYSAYEGNIGIETRGNSTQDFQKKTYAIELRTKDDQDSSVNLFGMGKEEDWILHAMVIDKSHLRIPLSFDLFTLMGNYASKWRYVELILNGEYRGLYILTERIKRDDDRVAIARLTSDDNIGDEVTGGYILRIDWLFDDPDGFSSDFPSQGGQNLFFQWYYPRAENITAPQRSYIQNWMRDLESALFADTYINEKGFRYDHYLDLESFVDFFLINELSKNADGYKLSSFVHKDRDSDGGKLKAGPIWDFDQTYGVSLVCSNDDYTGWTYLQNQDGCEDLESMPLWWRRLVEDPNFFRIAQNRWSAYRATFLSDASLDSWISEHVEIISQPIQRNFQRWNNFLGEQIWYEPEPVPEDYPAEISALLAWIQNRTAWMDTFLLRELPTSVVDGDTDIQIYPNPTSDLLHVSSVRPVNIQLVDMLGVEWYRGDRTAVNHVIQTSQLPTGIYLLRLRDERKLTTKKVVIR